MKDNCDGLGCGSRPFAWTPGTSSSRTLPIRTRSSTRSATTCASGCGRCAYHQLPLDHDSHCPQWHGSRARRLGLYHLQAGKRLEESAGRDRGAGQLHEYWERIEKFLKRVIPVCAEYKVAMANHPMTRRGCPTATRAGELRLAVHLHRVQEVRADVRQPLERLPDGSRRHRRRLDRREPDGAPLVQYMAERGRSSRSTCAISRAA